jgi:HlyD family secretion protein
MRSAALYLVGVLLAAAACRRNGDEAVAMGTVEVVEVDVAPMIPARVVRVWVNEGDLVKAGDTLVTLTQATLQPDIEGRRARVRAAEAQLRDLQAGARPAQLDRAEAELRLAEAEANRTASDVTRFTPLAKDGSISEQQFEAVRTAAATAAARRDAARESVRLLREGARPDLIRGARAEVEGARASLAGAVQTASDLILTAAVTGLVTGRNAEPGEILAPGEAAVTIGNVGAPYARVYVDQRLLPQLSIGDSVTATLDAFPDRPIAGRIVALNDRAEFTPRVALTEEERADLLFGVKVELRGGDGLLKAGLPIAVRFHPRDTATPDAPVVTPVIRDSAAPPEGGA